MNSITIYYPISYEAENVLAEAKKYGKVFTSPTNEDTREMHTSLTRDKLAELESFFMKNDVPYDLMEYSKGINLPKMKKVRPEQDKEKEINCAFYQSDEANPEEGVIAVKTLLSLIEQSTKDELADNLLEEIKKATFKFDDIENIFEM